MVAGAALAAPHIKDGLKALTGAVVGASSYSTCQFSLKSDQSDPRESVRIKAFSPAHPLTGGYGPTFGKSSAGGYGPTFCTLRDSVHTQPSPSTGPS